MNSRLGLFDSLNGGRVTEIVRIVNELHEESQVV